MSKSAMSTDIFNFNNTKLMDKLIKCLPDEKTTQNLIECKDDVFFVWNSKEFNLLTLNWRAACVKGDAVQYQTLFPSTPQNYTIDKILSSTEGGFIALSGKHGVSVIELPRRWGPNGQYQDGKEKIICRSFNLDEKFFALNSHVEVLQIRWHPTSPNDSHLLVLLSDNSIRMYSGSTLKHIWRVGARPCARSPADSKLLFLNSLGETAVDFDIAPPREVIWNDEKSSFNAKYSNESQKDSKIFEDSSKIVWPIVILRGNGSVFILMAGIDTDKPRLQGPISMIPSADDNYGLDYCSLLVLPSQPPTVVIAENSGRLHHALLMEAEEEKDTSFHEIDTSMQIFPTEFVLNVLEIVEIELGLQEKIEKKAHVCPIHLKKDVINDYRYFAYHDTGLHGITIKFIEELQNFVDAEDDTKQAPSFGTPSRFEYIVCTKAMKNNDLNPVLGLAFFQLPFGLALLLSSGQIVTLDLISDIYDMPEMAKSNDEIKIESPLKKMFKESFKTHIMNILKSGNSQPILKLNNSVEPTPQESFELLMQATQILREQYFTKHDKVRQEFQKRVKLLQCLKVQQKQQIEQLDIELEQIRENAEKLANTYDDICEKQQILYKRSMDLVRIAVAAMPVLSASEKDFCTQIKKINILTTELSKKIDLTKKRIQGQANQMEQFENVTKTKQICLPKKQEEIIKESITEITNGIDGQIKEVKKINNILSVS